MCNFFYSETEARSHSFACRKQLITMFAHMCKKCDSGKSVIIKSLIKFTYIFDQSDPRPISPPSDPVVP